MSVEGLEEKKTKQKLSPGLPSWRWTPSSLTAEENKGKRHGKDSDSEKNNETS